MNKHEWQQGELEDFPIEVIAKMLERQKEQGRGESIEHFQEYAATSTGFTWSSSPEGQTFWNDVIIDKRFYLFFEKYPKNKTHELWT